jgi:hypothetical protein
MSHDLRYLRWLSISHRVFGGVGGQRGAFVQVVENGIQNDTP